MLLEDRGESPASRRGAIVLLGVATLIGAALIVAAERAKPGFEEWLLEDLRSRVLLVAWILTLATALPLLAFAGYMWRRSRALATFLAVAAVLLTVFLWRVVLLLG